jgi:hypothetical protein
MNQSGFGPPIICTFDPPTRAAGNRMSSEREPLLANVVSENAVSQTSRRNLNQVSSTRFYWILAALWIPVFFGAMDGITGLV